MNIDLATIMQRSGYSHFLSSLFQTGWRQEFKLNCQRQLCNWCKECKVVRVVKRPEYQTIYKLIRNFLSLDRVWLAALNNTKMSVRGAVARVNDMIEESLWRKESRRYNYGTREWFDVVCWVIENG